MTFTLEFDQGKVKMNQHVTYLGQRSFGSKVIHCDDCSIWTTVIFSLHCTVMSVKG